MATAVESTQTVGHPSLISRATGQTLTRDNIQTANAGSYAVTVSNALGSVTSEAAILNVIVAPSEVVIAITVE